MRMRHLMWICALSLTTGSRSFPLEASAAILKRRWGCRSTWCAGTIRFTRVRASATSETESSSMRNPEAIECIELMVPLCDIVSDRIARYSMSRESVCLNDDHLDLLLMPILSDRGTDRRRRIPRCVCRKLYPSDMGSGIWHAQSNRPWLRKIEACDCLGNSYNKHSRPAGIVPAVARRLARYLPYIPMIASASIRVRAFQARRGDRSRCIRKTMLYRARTRRRG